MYYFVYFINTDLIHLSKRECHSFMVLNRASDASAAYWLPQAHVKNYRNFSPVVRPFFSVVEVPVKHSSLRNKK